jgi:NAD(P)-dependent dehydrogenase (short-subunit alcohol dehydrogenase family)
MAKDIFSVVGKTAIVTGASSGLGAAFAQILASRGANVVLAARRTDRLEELAGQIARDDGTALRITCDVANGAQVKDMVAKAWDRFGRVDTLVANAGTGVDYGLAPERLPEALFNQVVQVNLTGVWLCYREVGARMLRDGKGGSLIGIASAYGLSGQQQGGAAYHATKAAVINMTRTLALSWADRGVRVNVIAPGWFYSEMSTPFFESPACLRCIQNRIPVGWIGNPEELAGALLLLASDASSYMTGETFSVDGGWNVGTGAPRMPDEVMELFETAPPDGLGRRIMPGVPLRGQGAKFSRPSPRCRPEKSRTGRRLSRRPAMALPAPMHRVLRLQRRRRFAGKIDRSCPPQPTFPGSANKRPPWVDTVEKGDF